jgi:hypothetical protein
MRWEFRRGGFGSGGEEMRLLTARVTSRSNLRQNLVRRSAVVPARTFVSFSIVTGLSALRQIDAFENHGKIGLLRKDCKTKFPCICTDALIKTQHRKT